MREGEKRKRIVREVEDGKSKWGSRLKEDWKELGVNTVRGWCNKVKDRGWLASKLGTSKRGINFHKLESLQASTGCELSRIFSSFSLPLLLFRV